MLKRALLLSACTLALSAQAATEYYIQSNITGVKHMYDHAEGLVEDSHGGPTSNSLQYTGYLYAEDSADGDYDILYGGLRMEGRVGFSRGGSYIELHYDGVRGQIGDRGDISMTTGKVDIYRDGALAGVISMDGSHIDPATGLYAEAQPIDYSGNGNYCVKDTFFGCERSIQPIGINLNNGSRNPDHSITVELAGMPPSGPFDSFYSFERSIGALNILGEEVLQYHQGSFTFSAACATETGSCYETPLPAAAWLFGSAVVGLAGLGRTRTAI